MTLTFIAAVCAALLCDIIVGNQAWGDKGLMLLLRFIVMFGLFFLLFGALFGPQLGLRPAQPEKIGRQEVCKEFKLVTDQCVGIGASNDCGHGMPNHPIEIIRETK